MEVTTQHSPTKTLTTMDTPAGQVNCPGTESGALSGDTFARPFQITTYDESVSVPKRRLASWTLLFSWNFYCAPPLWGEFCFLKPTRSVSEDTSLLPAACSQLLAASSLLSLPKRKQRTSSPHIRTSDCGCCYPRGPHLSGLYHVSERAFVFQESPSRRAPQASSLLPRRDNDCAVRKCEYATCNRNPAPGQLTKLSRLRDAPSRRVAEPNYQRSSSLYIRETAGALCP